MTTLQLPATIRYLALAAIVLVLAYFGFMKYINPHLPWPPDPSLNPDPNHIHIDWLVYLNGDQLDFSDNKYMSGVSYDDASHDEESEYHHKYLHLHDNISNVVHRHKPGLVLAEFMDSIGFEWLPGSDCLTVPDRGEFCREDDLNRWRMFVNGDEVPFDLAYNFSDMDKVLLTYGSADSAIQEQIKAVPDDACLYSRTCPWRGDPPAENCIADPEVPCVAF